jgi:rod shape-determining protein MreC
MAPPVNRRTSYSRKAQYSTFAAYVAGVLGVLGGGAVLASSVFGHSAFGWMHMVAADVQAPAARIGAQTRAGAGDALSVAGGFLTSGPENARLRREVALARTRAIETQAVLDENRRLKDQLHLLSDTPQPLANAWLIASTASSTRRYATISAGAAQGVQTGMPVRTAQGLVGRVLEVGHGAARILLITDTESTVPVRRASDGTPAFINGKGDGTLQVRLLSLGLNPLKTGDVFVTSGAGGLYWPGTPMAQVVSLTHDGAIARPLSDPAASEMIAVQPAWEPTADPTLPPPTPEVPPPPPKKPKAPKAAKGAKPGAADAKKPHP